MLNFKLPSAGGLRCLLTALDWDAFSFMSFFASDEVMSLEQ